MRGKGEREEESVRKRKRGRGKPESEMSAKSVNTKGGSITVPLTSCLTGLESVV